MQERLILDRYRPISEAGSGGFATVQLAWDTRIQRKVAIKSIQLNADGSVRGKAPKRPRLTVKPETSQQYTPQSLDDLPGLDEARTAALLTDASIVGVYDFEIRGSTAYLIMEYVEGLTLKDLLKAYGDELSLHAIAAVFSAVARALEIAHENQVLHLDIKPGNILINHQGQVKVTDFGIAKLSTAAGFGAAKGGTLGYMPPEQMHQESLDARCDEWALASVAYEMISGENPFLVSDFAQAESAIVDAELVLPSLCIDGLPPEADDVLFSALDPDREGRYDSVADFAEEMEGFLGNPVKGQRELAVLVGNACESLEGADNEETVRRDGFFGFLGHRGKIVLSRVWSGCNAGILGFVALSNIPQIGGWATLPFWGVFALIVLGAVIKPHLGAVLALLALTVSLFAQGAVILGIVLLLLAVLWWFFVGRVGHNQSNTALSPALFGSFGFNQISPLLAGFLLNMKEALLNTGFALVLSVILASFGSSGLLGWNVFAFWDFSGLDVQGNAWALLTQPLTWCVIASWLLATAVVRLFRLRKSRGLAACGAALGTLMLAGGLCLGSWLASSQTSWMPGLIPYASTIGAGIVMVVVGALGVPTHEDDDNEEA